MRSWRASWTRSTIRSPASPSSTRWDDADVGGVSRLSPVRQQRCVRSFSTISVSYRSEPSVSALFNPLPSAGSRRAGPFLMGQQISTYICVCFVFFCLSRRFSHKNEVSLIGTSSPHSLLPRVRRSLCSRGPLDLSLVPAGGMTPHRSLWPSRRCRNGAYFGSRQCEDSWGYPKVLQSKSRRITRSFASWRDIVATSLDSARQHTLSVSVFRRILRWGNCRSLLRISGISVAVTSLDSVRQHTQSVPMCRRMVRWGNCRSLLRDLRDLRDFQDFRDFCPRWLGEFGRNLISDLETILFAGD